jgi:hypothetical protein
MTLSIADRACPTLLPIVTNTWRVPACPKRFVVTLLVRHALELEDLQLTLVTEG